jgi:hypothetical protein
LLVASGQHVGDGENDSGDSDDQGNKSVHEQAPQRQRMLRPIGRNLTPGARGVNILSESGVVELYFLKLYELGR